ncbi:Uncharacterized protein SCF082_LOCUS30867, partial [Durusdinium trenchii]
RSRRIQDPLGGPQKDQFGKTKTQDEWESEKQQRILNMLMGGKRGNLKKFFIAWIAGMDIQKKEDLIHERERAWQSTCMKDAGSHRCTAAARLRATAFELPFEALAAKMGGAFTGGLESPNLPKRLMNGAAGLVRPHSVGSLQDPFRLQEPVSKEEVKTAPKPAWVLGGEPVMHYKSGRKYKLDPLEMRISPLVDASATREQREQREQREGSKASSKGSPQRSALASPEAKGRHDRVHFEGERRSPRRPTMREAWTSVL